MTARKPGPLYKLLNTGPQAEERELGDRKYVTLCVYQLMESVRGMGGGGGS